MNDQTPRLISTDDYNQKVKGWSITTKRRVASNAPSVSGALRKSITQRVSLFYGEANRITFNFERHGVYIHYGVGRGYIRVGGQLIAGRRLTNPEQQRMLKRGDSKRDINKMRIVYGNHAGRTPNDWFDVEIKLGFNDLADISQEYYGDKIMKLLLKKMSKSTITKKL